ncbi:MAG: DUF4230 domain-containing protein [Chitinophagales bacterium]|nr:DUF4230 domain-containing protein [Chitinophagales bacterium]
MKYTKVILPFLLVLALIAAAYFIGMKTGANLVRKGLIDNYPTIKNIVHSAVTEVDTVVNFTLKKSDSETLFGYLGEKNSDSVLVSIPYYGRYGIDLAVRNFRIFERERNEVEVSLPAVRLLYCNFKFEQLLLNGKPATGLFGTENSQTIKNQLYELLHPVLEKNKEHQQVAKAAIAKALMFYFMPYKFSLSLYINELNVPLPQVPGINKDIDATLREMAGQ